jgi:alkylation response protein AidB-like acyl-CoA dehydrogenase
VPQKNLIDKEGTGQSQLMSFLDRARIYVAAQGVGVSQGSFDQSVEYLKKRVQFGHPIGRFQINQIKVADLSTMIEAARGLYYRAAWTIDQGKADRNLISMAKGFSAEVAEQVTGEGIQIFGGYGFTKEHNLERFYRDAQTVGICAGTIENNKLLIAKSFLGNLVPLS